MVLPLTEQPGKISVLTTVHPKLFGRLLPIGVRISIQKKRQVVVKKPLIYACKFAQEVNTALRNSVVRSEVNHAYLFEICIQIVSTKSLVRRMRQVDIAVPFIGEGHNEAMGIAFV
jgi:hypothetical protein